MTNGRNSKNVTVKFHNKPAEIAYLSVCYTKFKFKYPIFKKSRNKNKKQFLYDFLFEIGSYSSKLKLRRYNFFKQNMTVTNFLKLKI